MKADLPIGGTTSCDGEAQGGTAMPRDEFLCEKCKKPFERTMTLSEREKTKPGCPTCKGGKVTPLLGAFMTQTTKES
jgi:putative FmdB family regulatory protein